MHRLGNGNILMVYVDRDGTRAVTVAEDGMGGYTYVEEGIIV